MSRPGCRAGVPLLPVPASDLPVGPHDVNNRMNLEFQTTQNNIKPEDLLIIFLSFTFQDDMTEASAFIDSSLCQHRIELSRQLF
jgi:hypothetical protein